MFASLPDFNSRWLGGEPGQSHVWLQAVGGGDSVLVLLLLQGSVQVEWATGQKRSVAANSLIWLNTTAAMPVCWHLQPGSQHEALLLRYPEAWVRDTLASLRQEMAADFQALLLGPHPPVPMMTRPLQAEDRAWGKALLAPTLCTAARQLLEGSRMSEFFFRKVLAETRGEELFCTRTRRQALDRVAKVRAALLADLENPPALDELARLCGCNPQYLSRTFSEVAGTPISQYLRRLRIERAAELLASGRMNASEAALEVGYRSLSHFSQAFREEKGLPPSKWLRVPQTRLAG